MITDTLACLESPAWMGKANCRYTDPDIFYPTSTGKWNKMAVKTALKVCNRCPVTMECLQWALEIGDVHAILGATTPEMRGRMAREAALVGESFTEKDNRPWLFGQMISEARSRCVRVAESERLLGYIDNYKLYMDIADEFTGLPYWILQLKGRADWDELPPAA